MTSHTLSKEEHHVCPYSRVQHLDNWLRPLIHNPKKLFGSYLKPGMTALDIGCGGGFATVAMAKMVGSTGHVIAADVQEKMLDYVKKRAQAEALDSRIRFVKCQSDGIGLEDDIDFAVALFMLHEVPDQKAFFEEICAHLKPGGRLFIAEPLFHVARNTFEQEVRLGTSFGLIIESRPRVLGGRAVVFRKTRNN